MKREDIVTNLAHATGSEVERGDSGDKPMRITQGTFSFLPDLTAVNIEFTDDPHPRNIYWEMWGFPMFDIKDAAAAMTELAACRKVYGDRYIRISASDSSHGWESIRLSFIVNRPKEEPGFDLARQESDGRNIRYTTKPYATNKPAGQRYS